MLKLLSIILVFFVAGLTFVLATGFIFPVTQVVHADFKLRLHDANGRPLGNTDVYVWEYDHYTQRKKTNAAGEVLFENQSFQFSKILLNAWQTRPDRFSVRLRFPTLPDLDDLYYRFEVTNRRTAPYHVFNDAYDYFFGEHWLGEFNQSVQTARIVRDMGEAYTAVAPNNPCQCVGLWQTEVSVQPAPGKPNAFIIQMDLKQAGRWHYKG